jgi:tetratricopeptide (TPR) repeat protein
MKKIVRILLIIASIPSWLSAADFNPDKLFDKATTAYNNALYQEAISIYNQILEKDLHSAALYYNLGNAHYKMGEIAPSIYFYEKALLLQPGDKEILNNLSFAQNMTLDAIQPLPQTFLHKIYQTWVYFLPMDSWSYLGIGLMILFIVGFILFKVSYHPNTKRLTLIGSLVCLFLSISASGFAYLQFHDYRSDKPAIVFEVEVVVRAEPNVVAPESFRLHEGTKVQLIDSFGEWQKLKLADGQTGWIPQSTVKVLKDF